MMRFLATLLFCATAIVGLRPAFAEDRPALPEYIASAGKVRIAVAAYFAPLEMRDPKTNEIVGFDIDLGNAIAEELGLKAEWEDGQFAQMIASLISKRVDVIQSGMSDTKQRQATADFIDYLKSGQQAYALAEGPVNTLGDMCGRKVTVSRGTSSAKVLGAWSEVNCVGKGKDAVDILIDSSFGQQIANLKQKRAAAAVNVIEGIGPILEDAKGTMKLVGEPIGASHLGIAFRKEDTQLRDAYMWALKRLYADGTYEKLLEKWKLKPSAYPEPTINNAVE
jgi:polar amino acid transport system substrate-binding protein